jgi:hypothetical protein
MRTFIVLLVFLLALPVWGQFSYPAASSTSLIFPHLTDGGTTDQRWKVTITFTNPNTSQATVHVKFYGDSGSPPALDFGQGASATLNLTVPAGGTIPSGSPWTFPLPALGHTVFNLFDSQFGLKARQAGAALAFVISHVAAHGVLHFTDVPHSGPFMNDPEGLANAMAAGTLLKAGFDPSGDLYATCQKARKYWHPGNPSTIP